MLFSTSASCRFPAFFSIFSAFRSYLREEKRVDCINYSLTAVYFIIRRFTHESKRFWSFLFLCCFVFIANIVALCVFALILWCSIAMEGLDLLAEASAGLNAAGAKRKSAYRDENTRKGQLWAFEYDSDDDKAAPVAVKRGAGQSLANVRISSKPAQRGRSVVPAEDGRVGELDDDLDFEDEGDSGSDSDYEDESSGKEEKKSKKSTGTGKAKRAAHTDGKSEKPVSATQAKKAAKEAKNKETDAAVGWVNEKDDTIPKSKPEFKGPAMGPTLVVVDS